MPKRYQYHFIIVVLILFHAVNNYFWIKRYSEIGGCDICWHTDAAVSLRQSFERIILSQDGPIEKISRLLSSAKDYEMKWPILVPAIAAGFSFFCQDALLCIRFSNLLYFFILIFSLYLLGKKIHSPAAGMLAACLVSLYPAVFTFSRKFGLDFPLIAMVCLTLYLLVSCTGFSKRRQSVMFGISFGLSMLVKSGALFFVVVPLLFVIAMAWKDKKSRLNFALAAALALCIFLVWWYRIISPEGIGEIHDNILSRNANSQFKGGTFLQEMMFYPVGIYFNLSPLFFAVFAISLFFYLKKIKEDNYSIVMISIIAALVIFSIIPTKDDRYIFPLYGPIALVSAIGCLELPLSKRLKNALVVLLVFSGVCQFFAVSYSRDNFFLKQLTGQREWRYRMHSDNHQLIMGQFGRAIQGFIPGERTIGIVEAQYYKGDSCLRLGYLLKMLDRNNKVHLSCRGALPSKLDPEFLTAAQDYDFLIVFSPAQAGPQFTGLSRFCAEPLEKTGDLVDKFKSYRVIKEDLLLPEEVNVFLFKK